MCTISICINICIYVSRIRIFHVYVGTIRFVGQHIVFVSAWCACIWPLYFSAKWKKKIFNWRKTSSLKTPNRWNILSCPILLSETMNSTQIRLTNISCLMFSLSILATLLRAAHESCYNQAALKHLLLGSRSECVNTNRNPYTKS